MMRGWGAEVSRDV